MKSLKIVFSNYDDINNPYYGGGGANAIHDMAKRLAKKHSVLVLTGGYPGSQDIRRDGVEYRRIASSIFGPRIGQIFFHLLLIWHIRRLEFDVWIESFTPPTSTSFLQLFTRKPVVGLIQMLSGEDMMRKYKLPFYIIERWGLKTYNTLIVLTKQFEQKIRRYNPSCAIRVIPNGVDLPVFDPKASKEEYILFIGRLEFNQKGIDLLLKAYHQAGEKQALPLVIAGGGPQKEVDQIQKLIFQLGLERKVRLLGRVAGVQKDLLFRNAAYTVIPSRFETGYPLVSLEALSYRKPFVSFSIDGFSIFDNRVCLKAFPFDTQAFADQMTRLSNDPALRESLGQAGREFARQFTWDKKVAELENLLGELTTPPAPIPSKWLESIRSRKRAYFISPHHDDAALSAGGLMTELAKSMSVTVINVFTKATSDRPTFSAKRYLKQCGFESSSALFAARELEDNVALSKAKIEVVNLGFVDALWRKTPNPSWLSKLFGRFVPELMHIYPTYRFHARSGTLSPKDSISLGLVTQRLESLISPDSDAIVFVPSGIGGNVDHVLVKKACDSLFPSAIYWSDYPYNKNIPSLSHREEEQCFSYSENASKKTALIEGYITQYKAMFGATAVPVAKDVYFIPSRFLEIQRPSVSVGMPAYNEEQNIVPLLSAILRQTTRNFALKEIIVADDGSTDRTAEMAQSVNDPRIKVIESPLRRGGAQAQNMITHVASGDILVMLDSDVLPSNDRFIEELIKPIRLDSNTALVAGKPICFKPNAFFGSIIASSQEFKLSLYQRINFSDNIYLCHGRVRAFTRELYKQIVWPNDFPEDAYSYLFCRANGKSFEFAEQAAVYFRAPETFRDHVRQSRRFLEGRKRLTRLFPEEDLRRMYSIPISLLFPALTKAFFLNPLKTFVYLIASIGVRVLPPYKTSYNSLWEVSPTTKKLI